MRNIHGTHTEEVSSFVVTRVRIRFPIVHPKIAQRASHVAHVDFGIKLFSSDHTFSAAHCFLSGSGVRARVRVWFGTATACGDTMSDANAIVDFGIQDALRYVHVNLMPSVVLVVRDVAHIVVIAVSCIFFAWSLSRTHSLFGACWVFVKAAAAVITIQHVWARVLDPFVYDKTREYVELGKRRRFAAENPQPSSLGSLFSPNKQNTGTPAREDPLAEKRRAAAAGGSVAGTPPGTPRGGTPRGASRFGSKRDLGVDLAGRLAWNENENGNERMKTAADQALVASGPQISAGLRLAAVPVGRRGLALTELRDGARVCVELRGSGGGEKTSSGWSDGFLCVHPHKTYETSAAMGALNWGGHQIVVVGRHAVEAMCRGEVFSVDGKDSGGCRGSVDVGSSGFKKNAAPRASPERHEKDVARFVFRLHLFGTGREVTLRAESTGTLVTTFVTGVRFERRRVVAWHKQRSSKVLTTGMSMFSPPEGGAWEEFALVPVRRSVDLGLVPADGDGDTDPYDEFAFCRQREGTFWKHNGGGDGMMAFTKNLRDASAFRLHDAIVCGEGSE